jgi:hypothetical protein
MIKKEGEMKRHYSREEMFFILLQETRLSINQSRYLAKTLDEFTFREISELVKAILKISKGKDEI